MHLSTMEKIALILEAENEIKSLERELREIELLDQRGVVGAGELDSTHPASVSVEVRPAILILLRPFR